MQIYDDILATLGNTPLVKLRRSIRKAPIAAKIESFNPGSSVKDRIGSRSSKPASAKDC
jgi:cysteine synthase A